MKRALQWTAGVTAVVAIGGGWAVLTDDGATPSDATETAAPTATVTVEQTDLTEVTSLDGTMRHEHTLTVTVPATATAPTATGDARSTRTVTGIPELGTTVEQGDAVVEIDAVPMVLLYGDVPMHRGLAVGIADGDDVRQLEHALTLLGFGEGLTVDEHFDHETEAAVDAWEESLGVEADGRVDVGEVVFASGPVVVTATHAQVGTTSTAGAPVVDGAVPERQRTVMAGAAGTVTRAPVATQAPIAAGEVLYELDGARVVAASGELPLARTLSVGDDGDDVAQVEAALVELGYGSDLVVDESYDRATADAVRRYQEANGWPVDGHLGPEQLAIVPAGFSVGTVAADTGAAVDEHDAVAVLVDTSRVVEASVALDDQDLVLPGSEVSIRLPDGSTVPGTVLAVGVVASAAPPTAGQDAQPTVPVHLSVDGPVTATQAELPVDVEVRTVLAADVMTVPVNALVALAEGGFAIEIAEPTPTLVPVEIGATADGRVEVRGDGVDIGMSVVVP